MEKKQLSRLILTAIMIFMLACNAVTQIIPSAGQETPTSIPPSPVDTATPAPTAIPPTPTLAVTSMTSEKDGATLVLVPAGEFIMGVGDTPNSNDNTPAHTVYLDAYWIDQTEVTNGMYAQCVQNGGCKRPTDTSSNNNPSYYGNPEFDDYPVIYVEWDMAKAYCKWAGRRLPTEAEWEKAARGTDGRSFPWGEDTINGFENFAMIVGDTTKVASYEKGKSPYGAYDMAGNVHEWVNDWYDYEYYKNSPSSNPQGPDVGRPPARVLRGGSFVEDGFFSLTTTRVWNLDSLIGVGFRCASSDNIATTDSPNQPPAQQVTCADGMVIDYTETSKGVVLEICAFNESYEIPGLAKGAFAVGPNNQFFVYCTNGGDVFAVRAGDTQMQLIGSVKDFYMIRRGEVPEFAFSFEGNHPYKVTVRETESNETQVFPIPRFVSAP